MGDSLNGIFIDGTPLSTWLEEHDEVNKDIQKVRQENNQNFPYKKPVKQNHIVKEKDGKVRHLSTEEIMKEYGMESINVMGNTEKILSTMLNHLTDTKGLSGKDIIDLSGITGAHSSATGIISNVWRALGNNVFTRALVKDAQKPHYIYYQHRTIGLSEAYNQVKEYNRQIEKERQQKKTKQQETTKAEAESKDTFTEIKSEKPDQTINMNIHVDFNILFGIKGKQ